jgi:peptidoglycan/xylan/chitin deacetylase (PgdA/CDA1 family)
MERGMTRRSPTVLLTVNVHGIGPEAAATPPGELQGRFAHGRYTYGGGLERVLDMLRSKDVPATFFWPVFEAERCGDLLQRCLREGHEAASHGNAFEDLAQLGDGEGELLERARDRLAALTGSRPAGFRYTGSSFTPNTLPLLRQLGYAYDSSAIDDDAPYALAADGGGAMVELPWSEGLCDATYFGHRLTQDRALAHFLEQADALLDVDGYACLTLHPRADYGVGRAARLQMMEGLIDHLRERHGAQFKTCRALAQAQG